MTCQGHQWCPWLSIFRSKRQIKNLLPATKISEFKNKLSSFFSGITFGSYGGLAKDPGAPTQATAQAYGANPIAIIILIHRFRGHKFRRIFRC